MTKERNEAIDSFRGIACLIVVLTHFWAYFSWDYGFQDSYYAFWGIGKFAVAVFFILSAYFAYQKIDEMPMIFFVKRFLRVYIPYVIVSSLGWALGWLETKEDLIGALELTQVKAHLWTVVVEIRFYFVFMFFVALVRKFRLKERYRVIFLMVVAILSAWIFPPSKWQGNAQGVQWYLPVFVLGILCAMLQSKIGNTEKKKSLGYICDGMFVVLSALCILRVPIIRQCLFGIPMDASLINRYLEFGVIAAILFFCVLNSNLINRFFKWTKPLSYIGKRSYSVYLVHYIIFSLLRSCGLNAWMYTVLSMGLTIVLSWIVFELVEKKMTNYIVSMICG